MTRATKATPPMQAMPIIMGWLSVILLAAPDGLCGMIVAEEAEGVGEDSLVVVEDEIELEGLVVVNGEGARGVSKMEMQKEGRDTHWMWSKWGTKSRTLMMQQRS